MLIHDQKVSNANVAQKSISSGKEYDLIFFLADHFRNFSEVCLYIPGAHAKQPTPAASANFFGNKWGLRDRRSCDHHSR